VDERAGGKQQALGLELKGELILISRRIVVACVRADRASVARTHVPTPRVHARTLIVADKRATALRHCITRV